MSEFPQPTPAPIFNPANYPQVLSTGLQFPNAQGAETWFGLGSVLTISGTTLAYNDTSVSWANLATKVQAIGAVTQATDSTTLNVNNSVRIQNGETIINPTSYVDITSGLTNEIISTTDLIIEAPTIDISGQVIFDIPPHMPLPILGNDGATKSYVDGLVGQYSGGYNLFLNYSETDITYPTNKVLAKLVSSAVQQTNVITGFTSGTQIVATFISEPLGITEIPAGLWDAFVYGAVSGTAGDVHYSYEVFKVDDLGNETSIAQSGISGDVNASPNNNPTAYSINATFPTAVVMIPTDRIRIVLSVTKTGTSTISLTTYFESSYYSFVQTSLNAGTTLLSSNNVFTGTNEFSLPATTPTQTGTPANTDIVNYETITNLISVPSLSAVLGVGTDASANNITNVNILQTNSGVNVGSSSAPFCAITTTSIDLVMGTTDYPYSHIDKGLISLNTDSNNYARLSNLDTPRLGLTTPTRNLELTASSFYANGFGTEGQVLTRTAVDNEFEWEDTAIVNPIVSTLQYFITTTSPYFQYPPVAPSSALISSYQYFGWNFINSVALRKIDWFFAPDYAMIVSDVKGLYMNYLNITTTSNDNLPFISIYTKPTGVNDAIPFFAHSVMTYVPNFTPTAGTPYSSFMNITGTQPNPFPYGHQLGTMIQKSTDNPRGEYLPTEQVLAISVSTNTTSTINQVNFIMSKVGICLTQGNQENILNPQDILSVPTLAQVLTSGSNASSQNISGINTLTATSLISPTLDNSGGLVTIGANTTGLTLGKAGITTNIQGNLQIAGSAGSNAQVLTSNGTTASWSSLPASSWVGVATSNLSMGNNKILVGDGTDLNVDISNNGFKLYNQSTLSVDIGFENITLYRNGNPNKIASITADSGLFCYNGLEARGIQVSNTDIVIDNVAGSANQVLSKDSSNILTWATPSGSSWVGTATSDLTMGVYNISSAVLDNSGGLVTIGANTTGLTLGKAGITSNIQGVVKINNSAGSSGQVLTSTGSSTAPTWQTPTAGSASLAVVKTNPFLNTNAFAGGSNRSVYQNNFLNITPPTLTATYLIKAQLTCNNQGTNASLFGNLGIQAGGGAQTTSAINAFNGTAMTSNTTFSQSNSLSQCSVNTTSVFGQLSFTFIHTPATLTTLSYALWVGTTGNGAGTIFSMEIIQIIA